MQLSEIRGSGSRFSQILATLESEGLLPPHPGAALGEIPTVPNPPLINMVARSEHPWWLLKAHRGAVAEWTGKSCYVLGRTDPTKHPKWSKILWSASDALVEHSIAPARWAYWSILCWTHERGGKSMPPLPYVWSKTRIKKQRGWFRSDCPGLGGEPLNCAQISQLGKMWADGRNFVSSIDPTTPVGDIRRSVIEVVSMPRFQACLELAKLNLESTRKDLQVKASGGAWIWKITRKIRTTPENGG